jgi:hypothetical protein
MKFPAEVQNNLRNDEPFNLLRKYKLVDHVTIHVIELLMYILNVLLTVRHITSI